MITIANTITIAITIDIAIFPISPGPNEHTSAQNQWEAGARFRWIIWVGDLLSPRSKCLPFLQNLRRQLSTPWGWGILRSCRGGCANDNVQTMISTSVIISATICCPPSATHHMPHGASQTFPTIPHLPYTSSCLASATQEVSGSSMQEDTWEHIVKWDCECLPSWECTCERLGSVLGCVLGGILGSVLRAYLAAYSQAGWEFAIKCKWECTWEHARECNWERLESILGTVKSSRLRVCHRVQFGVYLRACSGVGLRASWELTWEHIVKQAGSVPSSAIGSVPSSAMRSVLKSMLGSTSASVLRAYLGRYCQPGSECAIECNWECAVMCNWECAW